MKVFGLCVNYLICSLDFKCTEAVARADFFGTGALKNFAMLEFLSNKVAGLKKRLQNRRFSVKFAKSLSASFSQNTSGGCLWKYLMNSLFMTYENDESCHCVVRIGSPALISFYCASFVSFYFFLFFNFLWILLLTQALR